MLRTLKTLTIVCLMLCAFLTPANAANVVTYEGTVETTATYQSFTPDLYEFAGGIAIYGIASDTIEAYTLVDPSGATDTVMLGLTPSPPTSEIFVGVAMNSAVPGGAVGVAIAGYTYVRVADNTTAEVGDWMTTTHGANTGEIIATSWATGSVKYGVGRVVVGGGSFIDTDEVALIYINGK